MMFMLVKLFLTNVLLLVVVKNNDESEWIIVEDTYKPIISKEDFNKVQELMSKRKKQNGKNNVDRKLVSLAPLAGLFSCHYSFKIKWLCS